MTTQADTLTKEKAAEHRGGKIAPLPKRRPSDPTRFSREELERYSGQLD